MYDYSKDKLIGSVELIGESSILRASIFSYNDGKPKLQFIRYKKDDNGDMKIVKLGRLDMSEVEFIMKSKDDIFNLLNSKQESDCK
jgi:hypothetical protein